MLASARTGKVTIKNCDVFYHLKRTGKNDEPQTARATYGFASAVRTLSTRPKVGLNLDPVALKLRDYGLVEGDVGAVVKATKVSLVKIVIETGSLTSHSGDSVVRN